MGLFDWLFSSSINEQKYGEIMEQIKDLEKPKITIRDLGEERRQTKLKNDIDSSRIISKIKELYNTDEVMQNNAFRITYCKHAELFRNIYGLSSVRYTDKYCDFEFCPYKKALLIKVYNLQEEKAVELAKLIAEIYSCTDINLTLDERPKE